MSHVVLDGVAYANAPQSTPSGPESTEGTQSAGQAEVAPSSIDEQKAVQPEPPKPNSNNCVCPEPPPGGGQPTPPPDGGQPTPPPGGGDNPGSDGGTPPPPPGGGEPTPPPGGGDNPGSDGGTPPAPPAGSVSVGDFVWHDVDRDGTQDDDEPGLPGVKLEVAGPDGKVIAGATTDGSGKYVFGNLPVLTGDQRYTVTVVKGPDGMKPTVAGAGGDRGDDSSNSPAQSEPLTTPGAKDLGVDFGFVPDGTPDKPKGDSHDVTPPPTPKPQNPGSAPNNANTVVPGKVKTAPTPSPTRIAKTGSDSLALGGAAATLLLIGATTALVRRRSSH